MTIRTRLLDRLTSRAWIQANALLRPFGRGWWVDALIVLGLARALFGLLQVAREWTGVQRPAIEIDLSPWALPAYTFFSMVRGLVAYVHLPGLHPGLRLLGRARPAGREAPGPAARHPAEHPGARLHARAWCWPWWPSSRGPTSASSWRP